jgi:hypothetical protein
MARVYRFLLVAALVGWANGPAAAATTVTFKSELPGTVKICIYNAGDVVQAIPRHVVSLGRGQSASWTKAPGKFHVKVFKPQAIDKLLASRNNVPYNTTIVVTSEEVQKIQAGGGSAADKEAAIVKLKLDDLQLEIDYSAKRSLVLHNGTGGTLKFCAYKSSDKKMVIPMKTWTLKKGKKATWRDAPSKFNLKVFKPGMIDKRVLTKKGVADRKTVRVYVSKKKYKASVR